MIILATLIVFLAAHSKGHIQTSIRNGEVPVRGVNLGGWLVAENWINPDDKLWEGVNLQIASQGEMALMRFLGHNEGDKRFENHRKTFITEADIAEIAKYGLNTVRVAVGYWIVGYDNNDQSNKQEWKTFAPGGLYYLDQLVNNWALKYNVAVLVDIHAAKGSQNGVFHSAPSQVGQANWDKYPENIANTVELARFIADRYQNSPAFLGLDLLNEPTGLDPAKMKSYYNQVHSVIRETENDCILVAAPLLYEQQPGEPNNWELLTPSPDYFNAWQDWHLYLIWGFEGKSPDYLMTNGVATIKDSIDKWNGTASLLVGECSLAYIAGTKFTDAQLTQYGINLFGALEKASAGWIYWTWKEGNDAPRANGDGDWCMRCLLRDKIINPSMWS